MMDFDGKPKPVCCLAKFARNAAGVWRRESVIRVAGMTKQETRSGTDVVDWGALSASEIKHVAYRLSPTPKTKTKKKKMRSSCERMTL